MKKTLTLLLLSLSLYADKTKSQTLGCYEGDDLILAYDYATENNMAGFEFLVNAKKCVLVPKGTNYQVIQDGGQVAMVIAVGSLQLFVIKGDWR